MDNLDSKCKPMIYQLITNLRVEMLYHHTMKLCTSQKIVIMLSILVLTCLVIVYLAIHWNLPSWVGPVLGAVVTSGWMIILAFWTKWWTKEKVQKSLLIADLTKLLEQTQFADISYFNGKIVKVDYREPQVKYPSEVKRIFRKYGLRLLLEKAKQNSKELQTGAEKSMKEFHTIIDGKLITVQLTRSMDVSKPLANNTYSFPKVCYAIFEEISGEKYGFNVQQGYLWHGDTKIARNGDFLNDLKTIVENAVKDKELIEKVNSFRESKTKRDSEPISQFQNQLRQIINQLQWD